MTRIPKYVTDRYGSSPGSIRIRALSTSGLRYVTAGDVFDAEICPTSPNAVWIGPNEYVGAGHRLNDGEWELVTTSLAVPDVSGELLTQKNEMLQVSQEAVGLELSSHEEIEMASTWLTEIKTKSAAVRERLEEITKPFNTALKSVRELFKPTLEAYEQAEAVLKQAILDGQARISTKNSEALATMDAMFAVGDVEAVRVAARSLESAALPDNLHTRTKWEYSIVNEPLIPREFLTVDVKKLRAHTKKHGDSVPVPGVLFKKVPILVASTPKGLTLEEANEVRRVTGQTPITAEEFEKR